MIEAAEKDEATDKEHQAVQLEAIFSLPLFFVFSLFIFYQLLKAYSRKKKKLTQLILLAILGLLLERILFFSFLFRTGYHFQRDKSIDECGQLVLYTFLYCILSYKWYQSYLFQMEEFNRNKKLKDFLLVWLPIQIIIIILMIYFIIYYTWLTKPHIYKFIYLMIVILQMIHFAQIFIYGMKTSETIKLYNKIICTKHYTLKFNIFLTFLLIAQTIKIIVNTFCLWGFIIEESNKQPDDERDDHSNQKTSLDKIIVTYNFWLYFSLKYFLDLLFNIILPFFLLYYIQPTPKFGYTSKTQIKVSAETEDLFKQLNLTSNLDQSC